MSFRGWGNVIVNDAELRQPPSRAYPMVMPAVLPRYTVDMLDALPDDPGVRYELIDGFLLVTPAPGVIHAAITTRLVLALAASIPESDAYVLPPGEVAVGKSNRLVPDILVIPSRFGLSAQWQDVSEWYLAIEIVSRSSAFYDREHKRRAYLALGVREYWVVDPRTQTVEVWRPGDDRPEVHDHTLTYLLPSGERPLTLDLHDLFRDVPADEDR